LLDRLRGSLASVLSSLGREAAKVLPDPTAWTLTGLIFAFLAAFSYAYYSAFLGGLLLLASGFFDILDGSVARATGMTSQRGAFLDSTLDRVSEVLVFLGILVGGHAGADEVIIALSFSLLVSYTRAKGDSLGVSLSGIGVGERSERLLVLIIASLVGAVEIGVLLVALLAFVTFVQRVFAVSRALTRPKPGVS
jgi:archaetidylinositol phosphate synthase